MISVLSLSMVGQTLLKLSFLSSSFTCGLAGALASNPIDVVRTRMMNQASQPSGGHSNYKGTLDCLLQVSSLHIIFSRNWCLDNNVGVELEIVSLCRN